MWFQKEIIKEVEGVKEVEIIKEIPFDVETLTDEQLEIELISRFGDLPRTVIEQELEDKIFEELRNIDGLHLYLQAVMNKDIIRYFSAQDDNSRILTRGAFTRTLYLKNRLKAKKKLDNKDNPRYAK